MAAAAKTLPKEKERLVFSSRKTESVSGGILQHYYVAATAALSAHFPLIDTWLAEHEPDLWKQIRVEDDELFRLRRLGSTESAYQERLDLLIALCAQAEQLYYEARPTELSLPPLAEGERLALYFEFADGSLRKMNDEED
jgi:hypothetical protein